jgi:phosphate-selective porin OprO/OprP
MNVFFIDRVFGPGLSGRDLVHVAAKGISVMVNAPRSLLLASSLFISLAGAAHAQEAPPPPPPPAAAAAAPESPPPPPSALEQRLDDVDQRTRIIDRKLELLDEATAARKATEPVLTASDRGFGWKSPDNTFALRLGGVLRLDGREFLDDKNLAPRDTFVARTARPILMATFFDVADLRLMPDFGNGTTALWDAYVDLRPFSWLGVRGGKFKTPLALERAQSEAAVVFPERAFPTNLAPNRDVGFELFGSVLGGAIAYEGGIFNGNLDNSVEDIDTNHAKDFAGRVFFMPWKGDPHALLSNLGFGFGASTGNLKGTAAVIAPRAVVAIPVLPAYRTVGQQTFFSYLVNDAALDSTTIAKGRRTRWSPQGYYYAGPFGILGEYIHESQHVAKGINTANLKHKAWQVAGYAVLGGKPTFDGVQVASPFDPRKGTWGALELALRYHVLDLDDATFPTFANPAASASKAQAFGAVLNWHWSRNIRLSLGYERTKFKGGAPLGADRRTENVLVERIQGAF